MTGDRTFLSIEKDNNLSQFQWPYSSLYSNSLYHLVYSDTNTSLKSLSRISIITNSCCFHLILNKLLLEYQDFYPASPNNLTEFSSKCLFKFKDSEMNYFTRKWNLYSTSLIIYLCKTCASLVSKVYQLDPDLQSLDQHQVHSLLYGAINFNTNL